jgi:tRNA (guanine10-N2)-methyltransferase
MATLYLLVFAQAHEEFRVPELLSVSKLYGFNVTFPRDAKDRDTTRPFMVLGLEDEDHARLLAKRCVLVKWAS